MAWLNRINAIKRAIVDQDQRRHMVSLGYNELIYFRNELTHVVIKYNV